MKTDSLANETWQFALETLKDTKDFVLEQAPLVVQELYAWHLTSSIIWVVVTAIVLGILVPKMIEFFKDYEYDLEEDKEGWGVFLVITNLVSIAIFTYNLFKMLQILIAPKLYLIEYITKGC